LEQKQQSTAQNVTTQLHSGLIFNQLTISNYDNIKMFLKHKRMLCTVTQMKMHQTVQKCLKISSNFECCISL